MRVLIVVPLVLLLTAPARAGTYEQYTLSAGAPGLDGWSPAVSAPGGFVAAGPGPGPVIGVQFWARSAFAVGDRGEWVYEAPPDTTVAAWVFERAVGGIGVGDWNTLFRVSEDGRWRTVAHDVPSVNRPWGPVAAPGLAARRLDAVLQCGGPARCVTAGTAWMALRNARVTLHDPYAPVVSLVQGDLVRDPVLRGSSALSFAAADRGGGVYRAVAEVDGRAPDPVAIGDERCRDVVPGDAGRQFAHRQPCPLTGGATVTVDTTKLTEGRHVVAVMVEDAAGNETTVYGPVSKLVDNRPDPPPSPKPAVRPPAPPPQPRPALPAPRVAISAWLERRGRRSVAMTVPYGERVRVRGRVRGAAGRSVSLDLRERLVAGSWRSLTGIRTRADGRFTAFTRVGPSRRVRIVAPGGAAAALTLRVRAPITAQLVRGGLRGRLRGGHVPRGGALVELQVRTRRRWITRGVVRTFSTGRYWGRVGARGTFRARVPRQPGLPFAPGVSPPRTAGRTAPRTSR